MALNRAGVVNGGVMTGAGGALTRAIAINPVVQTSNADVQQANANNLVQQPQQMTTIQNGMPTTVAMNGSSSSSPTQSISPPGNNAPKFGTLVPNRVFVGGISATTTEVELAQLFGAYGTVKAIKIISDRAGVSKGYGFVTFETEEEAKRLQREADNIILRDRKLNIAPAIKKQFLFQSFIARPIEGTPGSPPGISGIPIAGPPHGGSFGFFSTPASASTVNGYFPGGTIGYFNPTAVPANTNPADQTLYSAQSGIYQTGGGQATHHTSGTPVNVSQPNTVTVQQQACAQAVQQNLAVQNAALAAASGYSVLYPFCMPTSGAHPPQYVPYSSNISTNGFLATDGTTIPYSLPPQTTYVLLDTMQY